MINDNFLLFILGLECETFVVTLLESDCAVGTSLVMQWLRIHLPMQGTWVQALVQEDLTCHRATKPVHHNY